MGANRREFWKDNVFLGSASLIAGLFNYLYHVVLAHVLGPAHYGDLAAFLNVTALLVLPGPVVTLLYTRLGRRQGRSAVLESWALWGGGVGIWACLALFSVPAARALHVSAFLLVVFSLEVVPTMALAANIGILQHVRRYFGVGVITVLLTGFRVIAAGLAALLHYFPLFSVGVLEGLAATVAYLFSRHLVQKAPGDGDTSPGAVISGTAVVGVLNVLFSISDGLLTKHSLAGVVAGQYNGLATIGHTVQSVSGSFGTVMLTSILANPRERHHYLATTLGVYGGIALLAQALFSLKSVWVVKTVLGSHFIAVAAWLPYYGWGMIALGLINIGMLYSVAINRWEVIVTTGLGLAWWVNWLLTSRTLETFVRATTDTAVGVLVATAVIMTLTEMKIRVRARRRLGP